MDRILMCQNSGHVLNNIFEALILKHFYLMKLSGCLTLQEFPPIKLTQCYQAFLFIRNTFPTSGI